MMRRRLLLAVITALVLAGPAVADNGVRIGPYSDQLAPRRAVIGARIDVSRATAVRRAHAGELAEPQAQSIRRPGAALPRHKPREASPTLPNPFPPLAASAPILKAAHPAGPGSFWYSDGGGHTCMYAPDSVLPCFTVVSAGGAPGAAAVSPAGIAASVARRLPLLPGEIEASPARTGLTGAASWFWLDPAPQRRELSVSLGGENVTVLAEPAVEWRFGDGASLDGGPGVPYQPDAVPPEAITHVYQTRCLPGDQGHDPYVLASCGDHGYSVETLVAWRISYQATGPSTETGTLPTLTTTSDVVYPVGEARAFLVAGGGS